MMADGLMYALLAFSSGILAYVNAQSGQRFWTYVSSFATAIWTALALLSFLLASS